MRDQKAKRPFCKLAQLSGEGMQPHHETKVGMEHGEALRRVIERLRESRMLRTLLNSN